MIMPGGHYMQHITNMVMWQVGQPKEVDDLVYGGKLKGGFFLEAGNSNFSVNHCFQINFEVFSGGRP